MFADDLLSPTRRLPIEQQRLTFIEFGNATKIDDMARRGTRKAKDWLPVVRPRFLDGLHASAGRPGTARA